MQTLPGGIGGLAEGAVALGSEKIVGGSVAAALAPGSSCSVDGHVISSSWSIVDCHVEFCLRRLACNTESLVGSLTMPPPLYACCFTKHSPTVGICYPSVPPTLSLNSLYRSEPSLLFILHLARAFKQSDVIRRGTPDKTPKIFLWRSTVRSPFWSQPIAQARMCIKGLERTFIQ